MFFFLGVLRGLEGQYECSQVVFAVNVRLQICSIGDMAYKWGSHI